MKKSILMKLHLFVILSCIGVFSIQAQDPVDHSQSQILTDVVLPSPSVAALSKFVDIPVGYYTGVPNISIPFGELRGREISVPISISYHASGVRVSDIPGWVGSGWALNAGGVISRTMVGFPDEKAGVGYFDMIDEMPAADDPYFYSWVPETDTEKRQVAEGQWDLQPDMFTYSFNGQSGKFAFSVEADGSVTARTIPYRNIKIEPDWSNKRWTITTEDGTKYVFGTTLDGSRNAYETNHGDREGSHAFVSAWHLMEIISLNDTDRMDFYYGTVQELYDTSVSETRYEPISPVGAPILGPDYSYSSPSINPTYKLEKIESFNGSAVFGKTLGREDMYQDKGCKLSSIAFKDGNDVMYRKFELIHGYINGTSTNYMKKRLKLDQVVEKNANGESKPSYVFTYNQSKTLPARDSKSIDHWGYYNGEGNLTLIPEMEYADKKLSGGKRETNHQFTKAGILEKIKYPTGGETIFEYEGHNYGSTYMGSVDESIIESVTETFTLDSRYIQELGQEATYQFEIPYTQFVKFSYTIISELPQECNASVDIFDSDGKPVTAATYSTEIEKKILAGSYTVKLFALKKELARVNITYEREKKDENGEPVIVKTFPAGGLRIKKITTYDGNDHNNDIVRKFEYVSLNDSKRSSGKLLVKNRYDYQYKVPVTQNNWQGIPVESGTNTYLVRTSSNMNQNSSSSHICYSNVREIKGDNGEGGFTDYYYDYYGDVACRRFPFPRPQSRDWKRGNLVKTISYDSQGNPVQKEENEYEFMDKDGEPFFKLLPAFKSAYKRKSAYDHATEYYWEPYVIECAWKYLDSTITTTYLNGDSVVNVVDYTYNQTHSQLNEVNATGSDGKSNITRFYYPQDVNAELLPVVKTAMIDRHVISPQIKAEVFKKDQQSGVENQVGGTITTYALAGPSANKILPLNQKNYEGTAYQTKLTVDEYDTYGKLLQFHKEDDISRAYFWGYDHSQPVIKADNVSYSVLQTAVTSSLPSGFSTLEYLLTSTSGIGDMTTQVQKNLWKEFNTNLRKQSSLSEVLLSTYTYDPTLGVTSKTDPNGITSYYEYDDFGRLVAVKNDDEKLVASHVYHYAEELPPAQLSISQSSLSFGSSTGTQNVSISSNINWTAGDNASWITVNPVSGSGNGSVGISCSTNTSSSSRNGTVTISGEGLSKTVSISQEGAAPTPSLTVFPVSIHFPDYLSLRTVIVSSNVSWTVSSNRSWLDVSSSSGSNNGSFSVECEANRGTSGRSGTITVSGGGITRTISVTQEASSGGGV